MTPNEYQVKAMQTRNDEITNLLQCSCDGALGLCGEAGECADLIKKALFQGHKLDIHKLMEELGDTFWYIAYLCDLYNWHLEEVMQMNIAKLSKRYADGHFSSEQSIARIDMEKHDD